MTLLDQIRNSAKDDVGYYESKIASIKERLPVLEKVVERLTPEEDLTVTYYGSTFKFSSSSYADAFRITSRLLELFPDTERFTKEFDGSYTTPIWRWVGVIIEDDTSIIFIVDKATPAEDCLPRQEIHNYKTWVCESKEV